ncbi:hypothetical protein MKY30_23990 [Oceanobacillus sp. FSL W8-0428]|uniref:hypothetical protein n=1 Tax=Oceanobacillus sp. FSL W8-0428 TaxID=2921715 RepID=UPI0030FA9778
MKIAKPLDLTGDKYGRLTAMKLSYRDKRSNSFWICKCDCGNETVVRIGDLRSGNTTSCGCFREEQSNKALVERSTTHGHTKTRLYTIWHGMKLRCYTKSNASYKYYGGRGISVCDEWKDDFASFRTWSLSNGYKEGLTIDRVDANGNYEPSNCRWINYKGQARNKRNNKIITYRGESKTISEWSEITNIKQSTISERVRLGWDEAEAITRPAGKYVRKSDAVGN